MKIRPLNRDSKEEIIQVAERMRRTLQEVMGEEKGTNFYSQDWLLERVKWHLSLIDKAEIFLVEDDNNKIIAQAIVRIDIDNDISDKAFGYFSTIYVTRNQRRKGIARRLVERVHEWCVEKELTLITYSTAKNHEGLITLFKQFGYKVIIETNEMVRLKLNLESPTIFKGVLRLANREDIDEILRVHQSSIREIASKDHDEEQISSWSDHLKAEGYEQAMADGEEYYIAEERSRIVGFSSLKDDTVMAVYVSAEGSSRGVGRALYHALEKKAKKRQLENLYLTSSLTAREFYLKLGFKEIEEVEHQFKGGAKVRAFRMKKHLTRYFLGKEVNIIVDRPKGSRHPRFTEMIYPINYGYVPETVSGDGKELDAYILGVDESVNSFFGKCIAFIERIDDDDDKLIVVEKGKTYSNEQIMEQVLFQEKFFKSRIIRH